MSTTTLAMDTVPAYLRARGLSSISDRDWSVTQFTGGVSGSVYSAFDGDRRFVVKQSLERLAVEDDWVAPRTRIINEGRVMDLLGHIIPTHSPMALDVDEDTLTLTMEHAPLDWADWKTELLDSAVDIDIAGGLGSALGDIHRQTATRPWDLPPDDGAAGFLALRIEPFHHTVAERLPDHAAQIQSVAARVLSRHDCLVHGDFSPKNILVAPPGTPDRGFWIIDDEVGHRGDPVFDLAFFLSHLALKRIHGHPDARTDFDNAGAAFLREYQATGHEIDPQDLSEQVAVLVLSRIVGRSQVRYLDDSQRGQARTAGIELLTRAGEYDLDHPLRIH